MDKLLLEVRYLSLKLLLLCACSCKLGPESIKIPLQLLLLCGSVGFQLLKGGFAGFRACSVKGRLRFLVPEYTVNEHKRAKDEGYHGRNAMWWRRLRQHDVGAGASHLNGDRT